ncbi:MAG: cation transporter [Alphaproteobacteria bacterium]|nr:cation transporter [Alphaproteobacteria bacterium]MCB9930421.1 cation transporter [Alphaproteobacteria bacterium]
MADRDGHREHAHHHPHHHHAHHHAHHHHGHGDTGQGRLAAAVAINMALTVAQVVGGVLSGSLALIADALHNFSDAMSLVIALWARRIARRPADGRMTFGWARAEIVAALVNYTTLILIGLYLCVEAVMRLLDPQPVEGWTVVIVAGVALVIDAATVLLTLALARDNMNMRAVFLHNIADALGSVAVIVGGVVVLLYDWTLIDPLLTLAIAAYVLWHGATEIGQAVRILMNAAPDHLDTAEIARAMAGVDGVLDVHHIHVWQFDERRASVEAHIRLTSTRPDPAEVKRRVRDLLDREFGVRHATLETEAHDDDCPAPGRSHAA